MSPARVAAFALGPIGSAAIGLITVPVLAWYFPAEIIGRVAMLQVGISFCLLLFGLGLEQAYVREYHESRNKGGLFKASIVPGLVLLLLSLTLMILPWPGAISGMLFGVHEAGYSLLAGLCFVGAFALRFLSLILRLQERGLAFSLCQLLPKITFLCVIGSYVLTAEHFGLGQLLVAHAIAFTSVAVVCAWITRHDWLAESEPIGAAQFAKQLHFGLPLVVSGLAFWGMTSLDKVSLRHYASFHELGIYSMANSFAGVAIVVQSIFQTIWTPTAYKLHIGGEGAAPIHRMTNRVLAAAVIFIALAGLFSWCAALILPNEYRNCQYIIPACLVGPLFFTLGEASGIGLGIVRKSRLAMGAAMLALGINAITNRWFVPTYGAAGAASATAISFLFLLVLRTEFASQHWVPVPRVRLYGFATVVTVMSIAYALFGANRPLYFIALWATLLLVAFIGFRAELSGLAAWLRRNPRKTDIQ